VPRFVKRYGTIAKEISAAAALYAREVRERSFPGPEQVYSLE
jgi:3-methyl-2-oxobutanoate hydroxymethyltransferase